MMFNFRDAKVVPLRPLVPQAMQCDQGQERRGGWMVEPSYVARGGWALTSRPHFQSQALEITFEQRGWYHVFVRADIAAGAACEVGLLAQFDNHPHETPLVSEQNNLGFKSLHIATINLTDRRLRLRVPQLEDLVVDATALRGPTVTLDCLELIPLSDAERDGYRRHRAEPATRIVAGMLDSAGAYFESGQEAAATVYNHAQVGFTQVMLRCFAVRSNNYWTKVHELARVPGTDWFPRMIQRYDVLEASVAAARQFGVELHAVMRMNNVSSVHSEGNRSPDTAFRRANGDKVMRYRDGRPRNLLSYAYPEVRQHKIAIMKEIASYGVDGIVLDALRQPTTVMFDQPVVDAYRRETGCDPCEPRESVSERWLRFRADRTFTQLLREMRATLREMGPFKLTVRTFHEPEMALESGCDVRQWAREGLVDQIIAAPCYIERQPQVIDIRPMREAVGDGVKLLAKTWRMNSMIDTEHITAHVYDQGADGVLLYQSDRLIERPWSRMTAWNLRRPDTTRRLS